MVRATTKAGNSRAGALPAPTVVSCAPSTPPAVCPLLDRPIVRRSIRRLSCVCRHLCPAAASTSSAATATSSLAVATTTPTAAATAISISPATAAAAAVAAAVAAADAAAAAASSSTAATAWLSRGLFYRCTMLLLRFVHLKQRADQRRLMRLMPWLLRPRFRGLHSSTFRLNVSAFCGIGGAFRGR